MPFTDYPEKSALLPLAPNLCYPIERVIRFRTGVVRFLDDSTQRWKKHSSLFSFALEYTHLTKDELTTLRNFFFDMRGASHRDVSFVFKGVTYTKCGFQDDNFTYSERQPERYGVRLILRQFVNRSAVSGDPGPFPALNNPFIKPVGSPQPRVQRPYEVTSKMLTAKVDMPESEYRWASTIRNDQFHYTHYGLFSWTLPFSAINETEANAIEQHFLGAGGRWATFSFTDGEGVSHPHVRYAMDELHIRYEAPNHFSTTVLLEEDV